MGVGKKEVSMYYFLLNFTVVLTVEQMGNIVSVFSAGIWSVFLGIYHTNTKGKLGQYF